MKSTHLYLKASQIRELKALAKQSGAPVAALIRRAIDDYVRREKAKRSAARPNGTA